MNESSTITAQPSPWGWVASDTNQVIPYPPEPWSWRIVKENPDAVLPYKANPTDAGFDLTCIGIVKTVGLVTFFSTGLRWTPPAGFYVDIVPRSSLVKTGWILANSVGVIDPQYTGSVLVPLMKVDPNAKDLDLPGRYVQAIMRPMVYNVQIKEVATLEATDRGDGGFGSSGR